MLRWPVRTRGGVSSRYMNGERVSFKRQERLRTDVFVCGAVETEGGSEQTFLWCAVGQKAVTITSTTAEELLEATPAVLSERSEQ